MPEPIMKLEKFEGPLDLLLHLIEKNKVDIYDIPIVSITEQYIDYLHSLDEPDLERASQFLVMAAMLLQIKSRMLLPKLPREGDEEEEDPRETLVRMLVEYRKIKTVAAEMENMLDRASRYHTRPNLFTGTALQKLRHYPAARLLDALIHVVTPEPEPQVAIVERQEYDVGNKMKEIVLRLEKFPEGVEFSKAFVTTGTATEQVASFLAVLELLRLRVVRISQSEAFAPIYLFLRQGGEQDALGT